MKYTFWIFVTLVCLLLIGVFSFLAYEYNFLGINPRAEEKLLLKAQDAYLNGQPDEIIYSVLKLKYFRHDHLVILGEYAYLYSVTEEYHNVQKMLNVLEQEKIYSNNYYLTKAKLLTSQGKFQQAKDCFSNSATMFSNNLYNALPHDYAQIYFYEGNYATVKKTLDDAQNEFEKINQYQAFKAWFLSTCPDEKYRDGQTAVRIMEDIITRHKKSSSGADYSGDLYILSLAYAETGDFVKAEETVKQLIENTSFIPPLQKYYQRALEKFQHHEPIRTLPVKSTEK